MTMVVGVMRAEGEQIKTRRESEGSDLIEMLGDLIGRRTVGIGIKMTKERERERGRERERERERGRERKREEERVRLRFEVRSKDQVTESN
jgi:hypothetical protein